MFILTRGLCLGSSEQFTAYVGVNTELNVPHAAVCQSINIFPV